MYVWAVYLPAIRQNAWGCQNIYQYFEKQISNAELHKMDLLEKVIIFNILKVLFKT